MKKILKTLTTKNIFNFKCTCKYESILLNFSCNETKKCLNNNKVANLIRVDLKFWYIHGIIQIFNQ